MAEADASHPHGGDLFRLPPIFFSARMAVVGRWVKKNRADENRRPHPFPASGSLKNPGNGFSFLQGQPRAHHFVNRRADYY
jgi:hypothetical protein